MGKYASGLFYFSFLMVITTWLLVDYLYQSSTLQENQTVYVKQCKVVEYYITDEEYTIVTSLHDTFNITKAYSPRLTADALANLYAEQPCLIYYVGNEIVKLSQGGITFVDINYLEIKKQDLKDGPLAGFYGMLVLSLLSLFVTWMIPKFENWTKRKTVQSILMIPYTKKTGENLFEYKHLEKEALLHHDIHLQFSKYGNRNVITVYFPHPENLAKPVRMGIDTFQGKKYYNFTHRIMFSLNYKKLQQKIESKFI